MPAWLQVLTWTAAGITALWVIWSRGVVPMFKATRSAYRMVETASENIPTLLEIAAEFKPNDGASLRDRIDQIHLMVSENQTALETRITDHDHYHQGIEERLQRMEE